MGYEISGEIALKNNHYYYMCMITSSWKYLYSMQYK